MSLHVWWMFVATVFVISAVPGPTMLLVMTHGARFGLRRSTATMAGSLSALVLMLSVSAAGLGVFLEAWPRFFDALRLIGAAYLVWLGVKSWRTKASAIAVRDQSGDSGQSAESSDARTRYAKPAALFRNGFLVTGSNPKSILFAAALLPQFIDATRPVLPQFAVLVATLAVIEVSWFAVYAGLGARIGEKLKSAAVAQAFNRLTGGVFVGFGAMMALLRH